MSDTIIVDYNLSLTVREILAANVPAATRPIVTHNKFNAAATLKSTTTPPVSKCAVFQKALAAGVGTIDLTALVGTNNLAIDGTGLKVQAIKVQNPATNTHVLLLKPGTSNGYNLFGAASQIILNPGESIQWVGIDSASVPDIAAGAKNLALSDNSAGGTESHNFVIIMG
jgi:hypothetical protein